MVTFKLNKLTFYYNKSDLYFKLKLTIRYGFDRGILYYEYKYKMMQFIIICMVY